MRSNLLTARDAGDVVLDPESLKIVAVVVVGWVLMGTGAGTAFTFGGPLQPLFGLVGAIVALVGTALYYGGLLTLLVKLVHDAVVLARLR
jgi:hypothetical protein